MEKRNSKTKYIQTPGLTYHKIRLVLQSLIHRHLALDNDIEVLGLVALSEYQLATAELHVVKQLGQQLESLCLPLIHCLILLCLFRFSAFLVTSYKKGEEVMMEDVSRGESQISRINDTGTRTDISAV